MFLKNLLFKYGIIRIFSILGIFILLYALVELGFDWFPDTMELESKSADLTSDFELETENSYIKNKFNLNDLGLYNEDKLEIGFANSIIDSGNSSLLKDIQLSDFRIEDNVAYESWELNEQNIPLSNFYNYFTVTSNGISPFLVDPSADIDNVKINLTVNGEKQEFVKRENYTYFFRKNKDCKAIESLKIDYITKINNNEKTSLKLIIKDFNKKTELKGFEVKDGYAYEQWGYLAALDKTKSEKDFNKILADVSADKSTLIEEKIQYQALINRAYIYDETAKNYVLNENLSMSDSFKIMDVFTKYKAFDPVKVDLTYGKIAILKSKNETFLNDASCDKDTIEAELKINGVKCRFDSIYNDKKDIFFIFELNETLKKFVNSTETSNMFTARELNLSVKSKILNYNKIDITKIINQRLLTVEKGEDNVVEKWSLDFDRNKLSTGLSDYITFKLNIPYFQNTIELTDDVTGDSAKFFLEIDGTTIAAANVVGEDVNFLIDKNIKDSKDIRFIADFNRNYYENSILGFDSKIISMKNAKPKMASFIIYNKEYDSSVYKTSPYLQIYGVDIQKVVYDPQKINIDLSSLGGATNDYISVKSIKFSKNIRTVRKKLVKIIEGEELIKFLGIPELDASDDVEKNIPYISRFENGLILQKNSSVLNNLFKENKNNILLVIIGICLVLYFLCYPIMNKSIIPYFQKKSRLNITVRSAAALIVLALSITAFATSQLTIRVELANTVKDGKVDVSYEKVKGFVKNTLKTEKVVTRNKINFVEFNLPLNDVKRFALSTNVGPDASVYKNIALKIRYIKLKNFNSTKIQTDFLPKTIGDSNYLISNLDVKNWLSKMIILYLTISVFLSCYIFFLFDGIIGAVKDIGLRKESVNKIYEGFEFSSSIKNLISFLFIYGLALITINSVKFIPNKFVYYALFGVLGIYLFGAFWLRIRSGILSVLKIEKAMKIKNAIVNFANKNLVKNGFKLFLNAVVITIAFYLYFTPNFLEDFIPIILILSGIVLVFIDYDIIIKILKFIVKIIIIVIKFVIKFLERIIEYVKSQIQGKPYEQENASNKERVIKKIESALTKREINALYITLIAVVVILSISPILKFLKEEKTFNTVLIIVTIVFGILVFAFNKKKIEVIDAEREKELEEEKRREKEFDEKFKRFAPPEELSIWYNLKLLFKKFSSENENENKENDKNGKE